MIIYWWALKYQSGLHMLIGFFILFWYYQCKTVQKCRYAYFIVDYYCQHWETRYWWGVNVGNSCYYINDLHVNIKKMQDIQKALYLLQGSMLDASSTILYNWRPFISLSLSMTKRTWVPFSRKNYYSEVMYNKRAYPSWKTRWLLWKLVMLNLIIYTLDFGYSDSYSI